MSTEGTLFEKLWQRHVVSDFGEGFALLHVDRHIVPDFNGNAFTHLRRRGLQVRNPELTFATADHSVSTDPTVDVLQPSNPHVVQLRSDTREFGVHLFDLGQPGHGIVHVTAPEQGLVLPGLTVCIGDSHTCTHGALGALAWGVGQGELLHILATQTCVQRKPRTLRVNLLGALPPGTSAKDLILFLIGRFGASAGSGYAVEYGGPVIEAMSMEARFTLCNMSVEWGARYGLIAPDETAFEWLAGRPYAPRGAQWDAAVADWRTLASDADARFDHELTLDVSGLKPQVTWGNSLDMVAAVDGCVPDPHTEADPARRAAMQVSMDYMGLSPGQPMAGLSLHRVFIGSCTNARISDLRTAASVVRGRHVAAGVSAWVVPGSENVRREAEAEGLDRVFIAAGFEWRRPGCSLCLGANGETIGPGERALSTANRNFAGRQGPGSRTHLASPAVAAASACTGRITDPRELEPT